MLATIDLANESLAFQEDLLKASDQTTIIGQAYIALLGLADLGPIERLKRMQQLTLAYVREHVPYYQAIGQFESWEDLPALSRDQFVERHNELCNPGFPYEFFITSSGTSGKGGKFVQRHSIEFDLWDIFRAHTTPKDAPAVLALRLLDHYHGLRIVEKSSPMERRVQFPIAVPLHIQMLAEFIAQDQRLTEFDEVIIRGPQHHTRELVCYLEEQNIKPVPRVRFVIEMGSTPISDYWRDKVKLAFHNQAEIREMYGMSECPMSNSPVVNGSVKFPENIHAEILLDDGTVTTEPGLFGRLLVSHLYPFALRQPLLRYEVGDKGFFDKVGRFHFQGRTSDALLREGNKTFCFMHIMRALEGDPGLVYNPTTYAMANFGVIKQGTVDEPRLKISEHQGHHTLHVFLGAEDQADQEATKARVLEKLRRETQIQGVSTDAVFQRLSVTFHHASELNVDRDWRDIY